MNRDQNGNTISRNIERNGDGTYSATVWFGAGTASNPATNIRRNHGYLTRAAAREADVSETVAQTNSRVCGR